MMQVCIVDCEAPQKLLIFGRTVCLSFYYPCYSLLILFVIDIRMYATFRTIFAAIGSQCC